MVKTTNRNGFSSAFIIPYYASGYEQQDRRKILLENPKVDVVYSTFEVIDENNRLIPIEKISSPILEILESHVQSPPEGNNIWIKMGTETGITNITSSTAVRIKFAYRCPFPNE